MLYKLRFFMTSHSLMPSVKLYLISLQLSWALYSQTWEDAEQALQALMKTVDAFTELADADLEVAEDVRHYCFVILCTTLDLNSYDHAHGRNMIFCSFPG
jgi:hypothetical protein